MAQHKSAKKRHRQNVVRNIRNRGLRSQMRSAIKEARAAVETGADNKGDLLKAAISVVSRAASKKVLKPETASRYMSRLMRAGNR